jgi:hypothetical protein
LIPVKREWMARKRVDNDRSLKTWPRTMAKKAWKKLRRFAHSHDQITPTYIDGTH